MLKRQFVLLALLCAITLTNFVFAQTKSNDDDEKTKLIWSKIFVDPTAPSSIGGDGYTFVPAPQVPRAYTLKNGVEAIVYPNYRPKPTTNTTQSEMSIDMHPLTNEIIFGSANATPWPIAGIYGTGVYFSTNGGENWTGYDDPPFGRNSGDPASVIGTNGNFYIGFIDGLSNDGGQGVAVSTNNGSTWSRYVVAAAPPGFNDLLDKNHMWADKKPGSPYENRVYAAWTDFISGNANNYKLGFKYSTNGGQTWSTQKNISAGVGAYLDQGVNISTGPNGEVYAAWAIYQDGTVSTGEDAIGFNVSTDGGETWGVPRRIYNKTNFGIRGTLSSKAAIRVASFPSMTVDRNNGNMYIVFPQKGNVVPSGNSIDIVMIKSTDGGNTWTDGVRVNDDPMNNSKDQYYPWASVDQVSGQLYVVFYDSRDVRNDSAEVYMARSIDAGNTFENIKVSDAVFKPKPITGLAGGYQGDYIGITAHNNVVYPYWCDDRTGIYQGWITKVVVATYPLNPFNLNTLADNSTIQSFPNSATPYVFTWDTSSSTATYKWVFGSPTTNPRLITIPSNGNNLTITAGQLDDLLAGLGVAQGDSLVGQWDIWAYRNNAPDNDTLKSANGPRTITLKRGVPQLIPFSLVSPEDNSRLVTSSNNTSIINIKWTRSGEGVKYKWKFASPNFGTPAAIDLQANNSGYDTVLTVSNNALDAVLTGLGLATGDSLLGQWRVYAYKNPNDSLASVETFNITLKRQDLGEFLIVYDSTATNGRISRDSIQACLNRLGLTYDLRNRGGNTSTLQFSLRGYKKVVWLGAGTSLMANAQKDSLKNYFLSGGAAASNKSKIILFSEDVGYTLDRSSSTYYDSAFARSVLGFAYIADRPSSGGNHGLINLYTGEADSTIGTWPDIIRKAPGIPNTHSLYRFRYLNSEDSVNAVGRIANTYNTAIFAVDVHSLRNAFDSPSGSPVQRLLNRGIAFVDEIIIPVELTAFEADVVGNTVTLNWVTATELNNSGFEIERKLIEGAFEKAGFVKGKGTATEINSYSFTESKLQNGTYVYRLKQIDFDGTANYSKEIYLDINVPIEYSLEQNYPNPFNPETIIKYSIPVDGLVNISVYNTLGEKIAVLVNEVTKAGNHEINFNASRFASGVYFYRLESGKYISIKKMMLLK